MNTMMSVSSVSTGHQIRIKRADFVRRNPTATTMAIYNTGRHLFMCPHDVPATSFYDPANPWKWIPYNEFRDDSGFIILSTKRHYGVFSDQIRFQHLGHSAEAGSTALIRAGTTWDGNRQAFVIHRLFVIEAGHIRYIAVKSGRVMDSLDVFLPLPSIMFRTCYKVQREDEERFTLAQCTVCCEQDGE